MGFEDQHSGLPGCWFQARRGRQSLAGFPICGVVVEVSSVSFLTWILDRSSMSVKIILVRSSIFCYSVLTMKKKNAAAVLLGRLGGLKGGKARAKALSPERRKEIAKKAIETRWTKAREEAKA